MHPLTLAAACVGSNRCASSVQALRVAAAAAPSLGFVWDVLRDCPVHTYTVRRTRREVTLRPRRDLQVARELVSSNACDPPAPCAPR